MCVYQLCKRCAKDMHGKAWIGTFGSKCVKHTPNDQNMINKFDQGNPQSLVLIGVQNNIKMSFRHFIKHLMCTYKTNM